MALQQICDHTGHTTFEFDPKNDAAVAEAMERFEKLVGDGYIAAERTGPGTQRLVRSFNPQAEATVFHRQLVGG